MQAARFTTGTADLRKWLDTRKRTLEDARKPYEGLWSDLRLNYEPALGHALKGDVNLNDEEAQRDDNEIFNSAPRQLLHRLAAGLQSGITNQARQWFRFRSRAGHDSEVQAVRKFLDEMTEETQNVINRSNVYPALDQIYLRLGLFGQACALLVPDEPEGVRMIICDEGSYWLAQNRKGRVDTLLRRINMTYAQARDEFGTEALPGYIRDRLKEGATEERTTIWNLVFERGQGEPVLKDIPNDREFASVYWLEGVKNGIPRTSDALDNDGVVAIRSFTYNPIVAPRWMARSESAYGFGPGQMGLGDAKELQSLELAKMRLVEGESDPPMLVPASMRNDPIDTGPGGITYYTEQPSSTGTTRPVTRLFETRNSIEAVSMAIQSCEERLRQTFLQDLFALMMNLNLAPKTMTAREVSELSSEKVALLGPVLTRLNNDLLNPLIDAVWAVMAWQEEEGTADYGIADAPAGIAGEEFGIEYVSTLHAEQQSATRLTGLFRILEFAQGVAQFDENVIHKLDTFRMLDIAAKSYYEMGCVRDDEDAEKRMREAQQAQMAQRQLMAAQAQAEQAKAVKSLANSPVDTGDGQQTNALDLLAGAGEGAM